MTTLQDLFALSPKAFSATVYRYHNPNWAFNPTSGEGARLTGGRFNPKGMNALYTSLDPATALQEVTGTTSAKLIQPMLLCSYRVNLEKVLDLRPYRALFAPPWRKQLLTDETPPGHVFARHVVPNHLADAIVVPSYQANEGAYPGSNLVIFHYDNKSVSLIDDDNRLKSLFGSKFSG